MVVKKTCEMLPSGNPMVWIMIAIEPMLNVTASGVPSRKSTTMDERAR